MVKVLSPCKCETLVVSPYPAFKISTIMVFTLLLSPYDILTVPRHIAHKDNSSSKSKKESKNKSNEKNTEQSAKKDGTSSIFANLALVGLVIAAIGILVGLIIIKRRG